MRRLHRVKDAAREVRLNVVLLYDVAVVAADGVEEGEVCHFIPVLLVSWRLQLYSGVGGAGSALSAAGRVQRVVTMTISLPASLVAR